MSTLIEFLNHGRLPEAIGLGVISSAVVSIAALLTALTFRHRPAARHWILLVGLLSVLASPLLVAAAWRLDLSLVHLPLRTVANMNAVSITTAIEPIELSDVREFVSPQTAAVTPTSTAEHPVISNTVADTKAAQLYSMDHQIQRLLRADELLKTDDELQERTIVASPLQRLSWLQWILMVWDTGTVVLLAGALRSWPQLQQIRKTRQPVEDLEGVLKDIRRQHDVKKFQM